MLVLPESLGRAVLLPLYEASSNGENLPRGTKSFVWNAAWDCPIPLHPDFEADPVQLRRNRIATGLPQRSNSPNEAKCLSDL